MALGCGMGSFYIWIKILNRYQRCIIDVELGSNMASSIMKIRILEVFVSL